MIKMDNDKITFNDARDFLEIKRKAIAGVMGSYHEAVEDLNEKTLRNFFNYLSTLYEHCEVFIDGTGKGKIRMGNYFLRSNKDKCILIDNNLELDEDELDELFDELVGKKRKIYKAMKKANLLLPTDLKNSDSDYKDAINNEK